MPNFGEQPPNDVQIKSEEPFKERLFKENFFHQEDSAWVTTYLEN